MLLNVKVFKNGIYDNYCQLLRLIGNNCEFCVLCLNYKMSVSNRYILLLSIFSACSIFYIVVSSHYVVDILYASN